MKKDGLTETKMKFPFANFTFTSHQMIYLRLTGLVKNKWTEWEEYLPEETVVDILKLDTKGLIQRIKKSKPHHHQSFKVVFIDVSMRHNLGMVDSNIAEHRHEFTTILRRWVLSKLDGFELDDIPYSSKEFQLLDIPLIDSSILALRNPEYLPKDWKMIADSINRWLFLIPPGTEIPKKDITLVVPETK